MRHIISTTLLGPVLFAQGKITRARTPKLPEAGGDRSGRIGNGRAIKLMVLGDSSAAGVGASHQSEALLGRVLQDLSGTFSVSYRLLAQTGATTADCLQWLNNTETEPYDVVVTVLGVNDVTSLRTSRRWMSEQRELLATLHSRFSAGKVLVLGLPPVRHFPALPQPLRWYLGARADEFSDLLAEVAAEAGAAYLPFDIPFQRSAMADDGFHPGPPAYALWGEAVARRISIDLTSAL